MLKKLLFTASLLIVFICGCAAEKEASLMDQLAISVKDTSRAFSFTNKKFGQYYGLTNDQFNDGWMGWTFREQRIFNDYSLLEDNTPLDRLKSEAMVYPHMLKRKYSKAEETFFFADSLDLIILEYKDLENSAALRLDGFGGKTEVEKNGNIVRLDINNLLKGYSLFISSDKPIKTAEIRDGKPYISFGEETSVRIALLISDKDGAEIADHIKNAEALVNKKSRRIEKLLLESMVKTNSEEFNKALMWARVSLDALITAQDGKGIFAGLPWFNNYWGRDTFISLPGATYVTGNYQDARQILLSFAKYQDKNPQSPSYGRIPNRITLNETIYNTADGTPRFVIESYNYYNASGDKEFIKEIYPAVKLAFLSSLKRTDSNGFLTHLDAETWMDAVGPNGPWSPRGNRANDIQALWYRQLMNTFEMARLMNDVTTAGQALAAAQKVSRNFEHFFVDQESSIIYDRLKADGSPDSSIRPNLFFALNESDLFSTSLTRLKILSKAMGELVFPYGVLTLSQNDENFHPYHQYPPYYVKDEAYHNGIIWQWNFGPVITTLCGFGKQDMAWKLSKELTRQILHRGAAGTIAELMDAFPRQGEKEPRLSGTFSQAWSLAEYIRNFHQDYLGIRTDAPRRTVYLLPTMPEELTSARFVQKVGEEKLNISYEFSKDLYRISIEGADIKDTVTIGIGILNRANANFQVKSWVNRGDKLLVEIPAYSNSLNEMKVFRNGSPVKASSQIYNEPPQNVELYENIRFAEPRLNENLKALKGPGYSLLKNSGVKKSLPGAKLIFDIQDPAKDETYIYPSNPYFKDGILDLRQFTLKEDGENYYFTLVYRNLSNPGWHNEYGFQLTLSAICINTGLEKPGSKTPGLNSAFILPSGREFDRMITLGGGFDIRDSKGKILAAYLPEPSDVKNPLGNTQTSTVTFSVPRKLLGNITSGTIITILTGAQDDHGGAGVGEFRQVNINPSEWAGGGKKNTKDHNVYDILQIN